MFSASPAVPPAILGILLPQGGRASKGWSSAISAALLLSTAQLRLRDLCSPVRLRRASCAGRSRAGWAPTPRCRIRPSTSPHRTQASVEGDQCLISEPGTTEPRKRGARGISQLQAPSPGCCSSPGVLCSCLLLTFLILTNQFMFLVCITRLGFFFFNFNSNPSH